MDLSQTTIETAVFFKADLRGARLPTGLKACLFDQAILTERDLSESDLTGAELEGMDLSGINFENADLTRASLTGANLQGANLRGANLEMAQDGVVSMELYEEMMGYVEEYRSEHSAPE